MGSNVEIRNLSQQVFGRLRALRYHGSEGHGAIWECECECGNLCLARSDRLVAGRKRSCGCLAKGPPKAPKPKRLPKEPEPRYDLDGFRLPDRPADIRRSAKDVYDGETFGRLMVYKGPLGDGKPGWEDRRIPSPSMRYWLCQCKCGNYCVVRADRLASGSTKSCGCKRLKAIKAQIRRYEGRLAYSEAETESRAKAVWEWIARDNPNPFRWAEE